jgi:hypothetical protein
MPPVFRLLTTGNQKAAASGTLDTEDIFHMTNLSPRMTGLPMSVWVSPRGNARHDVRVKVNMTHGNQMSIDNTAVVAVRPSPRLIAGRLSSDDRRAIVDWITLNDEAIIAYWNEEIDTGQFIEKLKILSGT